MYGTVLLLMLLETSEEQWGKLNACKESICISPSVQCIWHSVRAGFSCIIEIKKPSPKINTSDNGPFSSLNMPPVLCYPPFSWQFTSSIHHKTSYSRRKRGQMSESKHRGLSIFQADLTSTSPSLSPFCHVQSFDGGCRP